MNTRFGLILLVLLIATVARAGQTLPEVTASSQQVTLTMHGKPSAVDAKLLPFIDGRTTSGKREHFGFHFAGQPRSAAVIELLGPNNAVLKTLTLGELLGEGTRPSFSSNVLNARRLESEYVASLQNGTVRFFIRGLVTGDATASTGGQQMVISFAIRTDKPLHTSMRVSLPISGTVQVRDRNIFVSPQNGIASLAAVALPALGTIALKKNIVTLTSPTIDVEENRDTAMLWLVCKAFAAPNAKGRSTAWSRDAKLGTNDPKVVVVSSVNKESTQPGDTITYTLVCSNIGTGNATDVALNNPIPDRSRYVENSATEDDFRVSVTRSQGAGIAGAAVKSITWKLPRPLAPGEERIVSFKVVIQ